MREKLQNDYYKFLYRRGKIRTRNVSRNRVPRG